MDQIFITHCSLDFSTCTYSSTKFFIKCRASVLDSWSWVRTSSFCSLVQSQNSSNVISSLLYFCRIWLYSYFAWRGVIFLS